MYTLKTLILSSFFLSFAGLFGIIVRILCFGKGRAFVNDHIVRGACKLILFLAGIKLEYDKSMIKSIDNNLIIFNHNSFLDVFLITSLPFINTYSIISMGTKKFIPLYLCNVAVGSFLVPLKKDKKNRAQFFKRVTQEFERSRHNIVSSPEGVHFFTKRISHFNKEIFKMALDAKKNTTALFFKINPHHNPFETFCFKPTTIKVECIAELQTSCWSQSELEGNISDIRKKYRTYNKEFLGGLNAKS